MSKWTKDLDIAEDFADDAIIKALESIDSYKGEKSKAQTWLYTIAINLVKKDYQDKQKMPSVSMDKELSNESNLSMFLSYDTGENEKIKYDELAKKAELVRNAIYSLSEKQDKYKKVLIMREIDNMTYDEISDYLNLNLSTVKSQIRQGRMIIADQVRKKIKHIDEHGLK